MSLYLPSGYLNAASLFSDPSPFVFMIGARGIGKTYGALKYVKDNSLRFVYLRMTDIEVKNLSAVPGLNFIESNFFRFSSTSVSGLSSKTT